MNWLTAWAAAGSAGMLIAVGWWLGMITARSHYRSMRGFQRMVDEHHAREGRD